MLAKDTSYVQRHLAEVIAAGQLRPGETVSEWGAGLGRFSRPLAARGFEVHAIELSPSQAEACREELRAWPEATVDVGDVLDVLGRSERRFDAVVGFFTLHHLTSLPDYFAAAARCLKPGGRLVFTEPNPWNPLFPIQITLTPGMRWAEESRDLRPLARTGTADGDGGRVSLCPDSVTPGRCLVPRTTPCTGGGASASSSP